MSVISAAHHQFGDGAPGRAGASVTVNTSGAAPELDVQLLNPAGHPRGAPIGIPAGPAGSAVVDPEITALAHGDVLTWVDAYSHSLQAHYAVLNPGGQVVAEGTYGSGYSSAFEAVALPNGGFGLADGETDLFGLHESLTFQTFSDRGVATGPVTTVAAATSSTGGSYFSNLEGAWTPAGVDLSWTDQSGPHTALVEPNGTVLNPAQAAVGMLRAGFSGDLFHDWTSASEMIGLSGLGHHDAWFA